MHNIIDSQIISRLITGDISAFNTVYDAYAGKVYGLAFRFLKNKEQSEEIVQEAFINLWLSRERLDLHGNMWLYLYVIAKRLSLSALRDISKSTILTEKLMSDINRIQNNTEETVLANDLEMFTKQAISKLPKQQQLVFKMSRIDGLSHKEIGLQLNISPNTVKNHIVEALKTIKSEIKYTDLIYLVALTFVK